MRLIFASVFSVAMTVLLSACAITDPLTAPGLWRPIGANQANLVASVADPEDLLHGRSDSVSDPNPVLAVLRYRNGHPKPLPASGLAEIKITPSGDTAAGAATAGGSADGSIGDGQ